MTDREDDEPGLELVMPFVACSSVGGPYEDEAYCAGYEMGALDATLTSSKAMGVLPVHATIQAGNRAQADLVAMKHGLVAVFEETYVEDWVSVTIDRKPITDA